MKFKILFFFFTFFISFLNANTFLLNNKDVIRLDEYTLYHFVQENENIDIKNIGNVNWQISSKGGNFGIVKRELWLKFVFNNESKESINKFLFFPFFFTNEIEIYQKENKSLEIIKINSLGRFNDINNNAKISGGWSSEIIFPSGISTLYVKVNHLYLPIRVNAFILEEKKIDKVIIYGYSIYWAWKGVFIFAMLFSLLIFIFLRQNVFFYFFIFNLGIFVTLNIEFGDYYYLKKDVTNSIVIFQRFANFLFVYFFPLFLNEILPIKKDFSKIWKLLKLGNSIFILLYILNLFTFIRIGEISFYITFYFLFYSVFVLLMSLVMLFGSTLKKRVNSLPLFILYLIFILFVVFDGYAQTFGIVLDGLYIYKTILFSSMFQIFSFLVFIAYLFYNVYADRNALILKQKNHDIEVVNAIVESQESERNIVGRELHDMIGANLSVIKQKTEKSNTLLIKIIDETISSIRHLSHGLITPSFKYDDFEDEIHDLIYLFKTDDLKISSYFHDWPYIKDKKVKTHIYRIIQEILQNAVKHSEASEIYFQFLNHKDNLTIMYEDNGIGFDIEDKKNYGIGILNIKNRISLIQATINFDSSSNGTIITINLN